MKTTINKFNSFIWGMLLMLLAAGCNSDNTSDLLLEGDTWLKTFQLDEYQGTIDNANKTIVVGVPETYNTTAMKITAIEVSEGAEASMKIGDIANFSFPKTLTVTNGNTFFNYTVTVKHDEARITSFKLNDTYAGVIDQENHSILVRVPTSVDITKMIPTIETSEGATTQPVSGEAIDFSTPVKFTVTYQTAQVVYTVNVIQSDAPQAVYVGLASSLDELNLEEKEAATWMIKTIPNAQYVSFDDIRSERIDLSQCKIMWWHLHVDGGIDNMDKFNNAAPQAIQALAKIKEFYTYGGNLLLTRYATYYATKLGAVLNNDIPNNCWGGYENNPDAPVGTPWDFKIQNEHTNHPLYNGIEKVDMGNNQIGIYMFDAGYRPTNTTAQYHVDWEPYKNYNGWREQTGAIDLAYGDPNTVVIWEYPTQGTKGGIVCIGSGCYDWYSYGTDISSDPYHGNVAKLTQNAIDYLTSESEN